MRPVVIQWSITEYRCACCRHLHCRSINVYLTSSKDYLVNEQVDTANFSQQGERGSIQDDQAGQTSDFDQTLSFEHARFVNVDNPDEPENVLNAASADNVARSRPSNSTHHQAQEEALKERSDAMKQQVQEGAKELVFEEPGIERSKSEQPHRCLVIAKQQ